MASRERQKRIVSNTAYTIGGALLMNGVLQILVYPLLNRFMGSDQLGELLYLMGLVAILCPSVGQALNTSRLVVRRDYEVANETIISSCSFSAGSERPCPYLWRKIP